LPPFESVPQPPREPRRLLKAALLGLCIGVAAGCASNVGTLAPGVHASGSKHDGQNISRALPAVSPTPIPADQVACAPGPAAALCAQLRAAYNLPAPGTGVPSGPAIAIVVAFDSSSAEQDLGTYRTQFGLPPCTTSNGCFQKVILPPTLGDLLPVLLAPLGSSSSTWSDERALDLAMASAACPNCRLILIESSGQDLDSLSAAVNTAATYNPVAISNSWGVAEHGSNATNIDSGAQADFDHPGIAITAAAGDLGNGAVQFPASSPYVTAIGGTSLAANAASARGWTETAWTGSGNGCSILIAQPAWQTANGSCGGWRSVPDVSLLADPTIGAAVYNTADNGWVVLGGTSIGAPFVAGLYAAAADYGGATIGAPSLYANLPNLNTVPGTNGSPNGLVGF
jgi:subtilase family serine protease